LVKLETQFKTHGTYNLLCFDHKLWKKYYLHVFLLSLQLHQQLLISKIPVVFCTSQITFIWFFFQGTTSPLFAIINFDPPALSTFTIFCSSVHRVFFHSCHFFFFSRSNIALSNNFHKSIIYYFFLSNNLH